MRAGHRQAQDMFLALGRRHGYQVRRQFTTEMPTDGVWLAGRDHGEFGGLPIAAIEVLVSEGSKTRLGSIATLEQVSPSVAIVLVHDVEMIRRIVRDGGTREQAER